MSGVLRYDSGALGAVQRTQQGGIRVEAAITRSGLFRYINPDGSTRVEYRPPSEVARADSLATLQDAPVTNLHHGMITSANWRKTACGTVSGSARLDGDMVVADLAIQDQHVIDLIESGERREVSCGYYARLDRTPGTTPEGEHYDVKQVDIAYNHVALVPRGRAGRDVAIRLDSEDNLISPVGYGEIDVKIEIINGVEFEVGSASHRAAVEARMDEARKLQERLDAADVAAGKIAALEAENKALQERLDSVDIAGAVKARVELQSQAERAGVEVREDMSDADIRAAVVGHVFPEMALDGKGEAFVLGVFEAAIAKSADGESAKRVRQDALDLKRGNHEEREDAADGGLAPDQVARRNMIKRTHKAANERRGLDKS